MDHHMKSPCNHSNHAGCWLWVATLTCYDEWEEQHSHFATKPKAPSQAVCVVCCWGSSWREFYSFVVAQWWQFYMSEAFLFNAWLRSESSPVLVMILYLFNPHFTSTLFVKRFSISVITMRTRQNLKVIENSKPCTLFQVLSIGQQN